MAIIAGSHVPKVIAFAKWGSEVITAPQPTVVIVGLTCRVVYASSRGSGSKRRVKRFLLIGTPFLFHEISRAPCVDFVLGVNRPSTIEGWIVDWRGLIEHINVREIRPSARNSAENSLMARWQARRSERVSKYFLQYYTTWSFRPINTSRGFVVHISSFAVVRNIQTELKAVHEFMM